MSLPSLPHGGHSGVWIGCLRKDAQDECALPFILSIHKRPQTLNSLISIHIPQVYIAPNWNTISHKKKCSEEIKLLYSLTEFNLTTSRRTGTFWFILFIGIKKSNFFPLNLFCVYVQVCVGMHVLVFLCLWMSYVKKAVHLGFETGSLTES